MTFTMMEKDQDMAKITVEEEVERISIEKILKRGTKMTPSKQGNGIRGGAARVSWCEREILIGQNHILFYFIFSCLFKIQNIYYQRGIKGLILGF